MSETEPPPPKTESPAVKALRTSHGAADEPPSPSRSSPRVTGASRSSKTHHRQSDEISTASAQPASSAATSSKFVPASPNKQRQRVALANKAPTPAKNRSASTSSTKSHAAHDDDNDEQPCFGSVELTAGADDDEWSDEGTPTYGYALCAYTPPTEAAGLDQLDFKQGQKLKLYNRHENGWWRADLHHPRGHIITGYVSVYYVDPFRYEKDYGVKLPRLEELSADEQAKRRELLPQTNEVKVAVRSLGDASHAATSSATSSASSSTSSTSTSSSSSSSSTSVASSMSLATSSSADRTSGDAPTASANAAAAPSAATTGNQAAAAAAAPAPKKICLLL